MQSAKVEMIINLKTAKALGLTVSLTNGDLQRHTFTVTAMVLWSENFRLT